MISTFPLLYALYYTLQMTVNGYYWVDFDYIMRWLCVFCWRWLTVHYNCSAISIDVCVFGRNSNVFQQAMLQILLGKNNKVFVTIADKIRNNRVSVAALNTSAAQCRPEDRFNLQPATLADFSQHVSIYGNSARLLRASCRFFPNGGRDITSKVIAPNHRGMPGWVGLVCLGE